MKRLKSRGITLIALVITIIVLLILAGVSIATLTGEDGILTKAKSAKEHSLLEEEKEQIKLAYSSVVADKMEKGENTTVSGTELEHELKFINMNVIVETKENNKIEILFSKSKNKYIVNGENGEIEENGNQQMVIVGQVVEKTMKNNYMDKDGDLATIPKGFAVVAGCEDISEGLVISDDPSDTEVDFENRIAKGNQFVWVPILDINDFKTIGGYYGGNQQEPDDEPYSTNEYTTEEIEYREMKQSVGIYHGFYIGRYETGKDNNGNAIIKKGVTVDYNVKWGNSMTDLTGGIVEKSRNFIKDKDIGGITTLCYGVQYDNTLRFIDPNYNQFSKDSRKQGWYSDNYNSVATGNTETNPSRVAGKDLIYKDNPTLIANKQKNIYDLAGNVYEWTMETNKASNKRVYRGGAYNNEGDRIPSSARDSSYDLTGSHIRGDDVGFRICLYIKAEE